DRRVLELEVTEHVVRLERELLLRADEVKMRIARARRKLELRLGIAAIDLGREGTCCGRAAHSVTLMFACFITSVHFLVSCSRSFANSSGELPRACDPSAAS